MQRIADNLFGAEDSHFGPGGLDDLLNEIFGHGS